MKRVFLASLLTAAFTFGLVAKAETPPPGYRPTEDRIMFKAGGIGTMGSVSQDRQSIGIAFLPVDHMQIGLNVGFSWDEAGQVMALPNGQVITNPQTGMPVRFTPVVDNYQWSWSALIAAEYMVVDKFPFAMGPQVAAMTTFAPGDAFNVIKVMPAWGFWYAPFNAPIGVGSSLGLDLTWSRNSDQEAYKFSIGFLTPAVRLVYVFN